MAIESQACHAHAAKLKPIIEAAMTRLSQKEANAKGLKQAEVYAEVVSQAGEVVKTAMRTVLFAMQEAIDHLKENEELDSENDGD